MGWQKAGDVAQSALDLPPRRFEEVMIDKDEQLSIAGEREAIKSRRIPATNNGRDTSAVGPVKFDPRGRTRKLSGRDYLDVKWRLVWARDEHDDLQIVTELVQLDLKEQGISFALFKATASFTVESIATMRRELVACTAYGSETSNDFRDFIEKAETKAIGRALHHLGYGTESMPDDGDALADSSVESADERARNDAFHAELRQLAEARKLLSMRAKWIGANSRRMGALVMAALELQEPIKALDLTLEQINLVLAATADIDKNAFADDEQPVTA